MGKPKTKLLNYYILVNRKCLYKNPLGKIKRKNNSCSPRPLTLSDFSLGDSPEVALLEALKEGGEVQPLTGTPPPIIAYTLILATTGGMNELIELQKEGIVADDVSQLVKEVGLKLRKRKFSADALAKKVLKAVQEANIFPDTPASLS
jgi:hypothetical protein